MSSELKKPASFEKSNEEHFHHYKRRRSSSNRKSSATGYGTKNATLFRKLFVNALIRKSTDAYDFCLENWAEQRWWWVFKIFLKLILNDMVLSWNDGLKNKHIFLRLWFQIICTLSLARSSFNGQSLANTAKIRVPKTVTHFFLSFANY